MEEIDYLVIGHVCKDLVPTGYRLGGTATFSALTAQALGQRVGVLTSTSDDMLPLIQPLQSIQLVCIPSEHPTTFKNVYTSSGRVQMLLGRATPLEASHLPEAWRSPRIVQLAPVADEITPDLGSQFPNALVGVTPQGWMRQWDGAGHVSYSAWESAPQVLSHSQAAVLSIEDVEGDEDAVRRLADQASILIVTRGADGSTLYLNGRPQPIAAPAVTERDPTGAGDIFAAAFFVRLSATGEPFTAARFATGLASASVTRVGLASIPDTATIEAALASERGSF